MCVVNALPLVFKAKTDFMKISEEISFKMTPMSFVDFVLR